MPARARDAAAVIVAGLGVLLTLPGSSDLSLELLWVIHLPFQATAELPGPVVTELDSDGAVEIVLVDGTSTLRVYRMPKGASDVMAITEPAAEARSSAATRVVHGRRPVALAAGFLEPYSVASRQRRVVLVREDWTVQCYDHKLRLLWERHLEHGEGIRDLGVSPYRVEEAAAALATATASGDEELARGGAIGPNGIVLVGGSMRAAADSGAADAKGAAIRLETLSEGDDGGNEAAIDAAERELAAAHHFSFHALDGGSGSVLWEHKGSADDTKSPLGAEENAAGDEAKANAAAAAASKSWRPQHKMKELEDLDVERFGAPHGWRAYSQSLMASALPHSWQSAGDTALQIAHFNRKKRRDGAVQAPSKGATAADAKGGMARKLASRISAALPFAAVRPHDESEHVPEPNVVVAHTKAGLEAIGLQTGRPVCSVPLAAAAAAAAAAGGGSDLYADIDGDGEIERVRVLDGSSSAAFGEDAKAGLSCVAVATRGVPPKEKLFNVSLCNSNDNPFDPLLLHAAAASGANRPVRSRRQRRRVTVAAPVFLRHQPSAGSSGGRLEQTAKAPAGQAGDVIFATSSGVVASYDGRNGALNWRDANGPTWSGAMATETADTAKQRGYALALPIRADAAPGQRRRRRSEASDHVLIAGKDLLAVYGRLGRLLATAPLLEPPLRRPTVADLDGDGVNDVLVCGQHFLAGYKVARVTGSFLPAAIAAVVAVMAALVALAHGVSPGNGRRGGGGGGSGGGSSVSGGTGRKKDARATD